MRDQKSTLDDAVELDKASPQGQEHVQSQDTDVYSSGVNVGLPRLSKRSKPFAFFEFWPTWVFYLPIAVYWILLSLRYRSFGLPMLANPNLHLGGMMGESKVDILDAGEAMAKSYILPYLLRDSLVDPVLHKCDDSLTQQVDNDIAAARAEGIVLPFVVKPELGCRGVGVRVIASKHDLVTYLKDFPLDRRYIIQQLAPYCAEAGVFYERFPGEAKGKVTSLTLKYRPTVIGDGVSSLASLILQDSRAAILRALYLEKNRQRCKWIPEQGEEVALCFAGSHCRGSIFRNGNSYITEQMSQKIDQIMTGFPNFHYGRLDVKFSDIRTLQRGVDFCIIEINGVSSEKAHIWDSRGSLRSAFATLFEQYTTLFKMGVALRRKGYKPPSIITLAATCLGELKHRRRYPTTD